MKTTRDPGCPFVVMQHGDENGGWDEHCNKIPSENSRFCPKHVLVAADLEEKKKSFAQRMNQAKILRRVDKALAEQALARSPLRAENPDFDQKKDLGYSR